MIQELPIPDVIHAAHRWVVDGVVLRLEGLLINADDALFEMATLSTEEFDQRRCFDLARQLRLQRDQIIGGYRHVMDRGRRVWALRDFRSRSSDAAWEHARNLGAKAQTHFAPLLNVLARDFSDLLECPVDSFDLLPISPTWIANGYIEARREAGFSAAATLFLDRLFVRYVVDRLGGVYGEVHGMLETALQVHMRPSAPTSVPGWQLEPLVPANRTTLRETVARRSQG